MNDDFVCGWPLLHTPRKVMVMARWLAKRAVIQDLKASGYKVQYIEQAAISEATEAYLRRHASDLIDQAEGLLNKS